MRRMAVWVLSFVALYGLVFGQYTQEWTSGNIGQYGWGGAYAYDIDSDGLVEFEVRRSGQFTFYNGNYTVAWNISWPGYDYISVTHPRDTDGDGRLVPLNTDTDGAGELVISGYYLSGSTYYGRFRVYDAVTRNMEFESPLLTGYYGNATVEDLDGDGRDEIVLTRFGSASTESYVDVYAFQTEVKEGKAVYAVRKSGQAFPNPTTSKVMIPFSVGPDQSGKSTRVVVYDAAGRMVTELMRSEKTGQGDYCLVWAGVDQRGVLVPAGKYFVRITIGDHTRSMPVEIVW